MIALLLLAILSVGVLIFVAVVVFHGDLLDALTRGGAQRRMDAAQQIGLRDPASWSITIERHVPQRNPGIGRRVVDIDETRQRREVER